MISTHTSPHGLTPEKLKRAREEALQRFGTKNAPVTGLILGGNSGPVKWNEESAKEFANLLTYLPKNEPIFATPSRRTPPVLVNTLKATQKEHDFWIWENEGENPYLQILTHADRLIVTGDSHNMVSECLAMDIPVYVHRPPKRQKKLHAFLDVMEKQSEVAPRTNSIEKFTRNSRDATAEIAAEIERRL